MQKTRIGQASFFLFASAFLLMACRQGPEAVEVTRIVRETITEVIEVEGQTQVVEVEVTRVVVEEAPASQDDEDASEEGALANVYRIGIREEPLTINIWNDLGRDNWVWNVGTILQDARTYSVREDNSSLIPWLATDLPPQPVLEGDHWTITIEIVDDALWSDGTPITARDVAFVLNSCLALDLGLHWPGECKPEILDRVEAINDTTVKYYFKDIPSLSDWQLGVAQAPILPEHFWGSAVEGALALVSDLEEPLPPTEVDDCLDAELSEEETDVCAPYLDALDGYEEAFVNARSVLYNADSTGMPSGDAFIIERWERGAFVHLRANPNYYFRGAEVIEYDDGTWIRTLADGRSMQFYGDGAGKETRRYTLGPYFDDLIFTVYSSQDSAVQALDVGEIDFMLYPQPTRGMIERIEGSDHARVMINPDNFLAYMSFNMRHEPFSLPEFRQAVEILMDKEFVTDSVFQGDITAAYGIVPPANEAWNNEEVQGQYLGLSRSERLDLAIQTLEDAGWTWDRKPEWDREGDPEAQDLTAGKGLRMPDGQFMEPFEIVGPGAAYDPRRATYNHWISEWLREVGIPATTKFIPFQSIIPRFLSGDFDMIIAGVPWGDYPPDYLCNFFHSQYDTVEAGGFNISGYSNPAYDELCDNLVNQNDNLQAQGLARELQSILAQDRPWIPLFFQRTVEMIGNNVILPYEDELGGISNSYGLPIVAKIKERD